MKVLYRTLLISLFLSTPYWAMADETPKSSFPVQMETWHVVRGDTLSEIVQKLLPNNRELREPLMYKILELNPIVFPTSNIDFMLAYHTLFFPTHIGGINIKTTIENHIKNQPAKASIENSHIESLDDDAVTTQSIYLAPKPVIKKQIQNRFYSLSPDNIEAPYTPNDKIKNHYQYISEGSATGIIRIENGPAFKLEKNTRIKVFLKEIDNATQCQIYLIYGLLRIQEKNTATQHCDIETKTAKIIAKQSDYVVRVCDLDNCVLIDKYNNKSRLPEGLYYGVVRGQIEVATEFKRYHLNSGEIYYYSLKNKAPLKLKHFKGLLFRDADINAIKNNKTPKQQFAWGSIMFSPKDPDYVAPLDDFKTDISIINKPTSIKIKPKDNTVNQTSPDTSNVLDRFK